MISLENVSFSYGQKEPVIRDLTVEVGNGRIYGLFGKNGSGKTTLLKLMSGLLFARRGSILGMEPRNGATQIDANVPLASMFGYATDLRSRTQGRGQYSMEPSHYIELPKSLQEEIISKRSKG